MVLKKQKAGVNSGNTIRCPTAAFKTQYASQAAIVKYVIGSDQSVHNTLKDNLVPMVHYSLNKKQRWNLIKKIKKVILKEIAEQASGPTVSLAERHKLKRKNNCYEFYSRTAIRRYVPKRKRKNRLPGSTNINRIPRRYFHISNPVEANILKERTASVVEETKEADWEVEPEVRYEVYAPCPRSSSLTHNPKYMRSVAIRHEDDGFSSSRCRGGKRRQVLHSRDVEELIAEFEAEGDEEVWEAISEICPERRVSNWQLDLGELLQRASPPRRARCRPLHGLRAASAAAVVC